jgi:hypothetical protein
LDGPFLTADDIERTIASVDPSRNLQLNDALDILKRTVKSDAVAPQSPFVSNAPEGQYALFFGSRVDRLEHVIHAEVYQPGKFRMFDPQNGQTVTLDDLMSLRIKWGGSADSPVVPYLIKGTE